MRNPTFDIAKLIAMLLVVAGHLTGNAIIARESGISYLSNVSIGVAMPLFFIISGYFAVKTLDSGDAVKMVARIVGFLWPLAAFGIVFSIILLLFDKISLCKAALYPVIRVWGGSWFLATLAIIYAVVGIVWKSVAQMKWRLLAMGLIYVILFFTAGQGKVSSLLHLHSVLHMFPYFVFGVMVLRPFDVYKRLSVAIPCGVFFLAVIFLEGNVWTNGMAFYWVPVDWQTVIADQHLFLCFWARSAVGIAGSVFVLYMIDRLLNLLPCLSMVAVYGTTTLGVYVMHEWPLVQINKYLQFGPLPSYWRWPVAFALYFACHYLTVLIRRYPKSKFFFFGDEKRLVTVIYAWRSKCFSR